MKRMRILGMAGAIALALGVAQAAEFPTAPPNMKEVETMGWPRLNTEDLKGYFPGTIDAKGPTGRHLFVHDANGTCVRKAAKHAVGSDTSGTWHVNEKSNTYCRAMPKMGKGVMAKGGNEEHCFAVFRAPDGTHFFSYDVKDGFYAHTWRKANE